MVKYCDNDVLVFFGGRRLEKLHYKWQLFDLHENTIAEIRLKPYFFSFSPDEEFRISFSDNNDTYNLFMYYKTKKAPHYEIDFNNDTYEIIVHKGNKVSFFKNQLQFAYYIKQAITFGEADRLQVVADDDTNISFLCMLIYVTICTTETNDGTINFNLGNLSREMKAFDTQWKPKLNFSN